MYQDLGINRFLIGEAFMRSGDITAKFKELTTAPHQFSSPARGED
jgi:indole-3-glycerol phosphate synthase